jgi:hypothetical protein
MFETKARSFDDIWVDFCGTLMRVFAAPEAAKPRAETGCQAK